MKKIKEKAWELGFSFCGIAPARTLTELKEYHARFIAEKHYTRLSYIEKYAAQRIDPFKLMPEVKSVIAVLLNYYPEEIIPEENNFIVSKYAYGREYRWVLKEKMRKLTDFLVNLEPGCKAMAYVDSGPVLEKAWAQRCGVGWQGKNTILINKYAGSFFFIGIILTSLTTEYDMPAEDHCGSCTRCMDACPTGAITAPYELDPSLCIAYQTIVNKDTIPPEIAGKLSDRIFGCDICQDVCPFNKFSSPAAEASFHPSEELRNLRKPDWINLSEEDFDRIFRNSPVRKTGYRKIMNTVNLVSSR